MKKLLKYLNVFTIALLLGLNVTNVSAAEKTCEPGTTKHTNYYLFLEGSSVETYVPSENYRYTGADYYNNIKGAQIIEQGNINIGTSAKGTVSNASKNWTVSQYWNFFKAAYNGADRNTLIYTSNNSNYILHKSWWEYENPNFIGGTEKDADNEYITSLITHLNGITSSNLESSTLVTAGTALPATSVVAPTGLATSNDTSLRWNLVRNYSSVTGLTGVNVNTNYAHNQVYSPAAYYVEYCVEDSTDDGESNVEDTKKTFTVTYDANGGQDAPASQEGNKGSCIKLSDKKPTLEKNNFLGWSTDKNAKEADKNYASGTEYCDGKDLTLYAVWQVQSGVSAHVIGFALIALTAGVALIIAKKKNLFRQI